MKAVLYRDLSGLYLMENSNVNIEVVIHLKTTHTTYAWVTCRTPQWEEMAQNQWTRAANPTIAVLERLRAWPSGHRTAIPGTASKSHFCNCGKEK